MPTPISSVETRIKTLKVVLAGRDERKLVERTLTDAGGDWSVALTELENKLSKASIQKLEFAHTLADLSDDNVNVVKALSDDPKIVNLRDVALNFNVEGFTKLVNPAAAPGTAAHDKAKAAATGLRRKLFATETTAVLQRMVKDAEIPIADTKVLSGVTRFLDNQREFDIRTTSVYTALKDPRAFKDIAEEQRAGVVEQLKTLQRVQAITPVPEAMPVLMKANLTSAFHVGEMPESTFLSAYSEALGGEEIARQVYTNSINNRTRNEQALMTMRESWRGTGLAIMDGQKPMEDRMAMMQTVADEKGVPLNLENLFGSIDYCECDECQSVYSPASYFVELLQYLRNNNLDPTNPNTSQKGYANTPLEKLFRRRPNLGCLELTCENTFTVLPYIDLVNEVMESFVVHLGEYHADKNDPKQATLEAFNVEDETTSELLAQAQHTNYEAYCILKNAVYPFTLPYHQPIDAIRIFLNYLGTSRYELLDTYRTAHEACPSTALTPPELQEIQTLHQLVQNRAVDAEFLGLTQEEYIILSKEAFWPKRYFDITQQTTHTAQEYREKIGVKPVHEYYGYDKEADMLSTDESKKLGLTFVKKQFLPRTGIQYTDLVELLKTRFINPNFPQGKALTLLESIRFSYRFLQTLVVPGTDPAIHFAKLVDFLEKTQPFLPLLDARLHPDPCNKHKIDACMETKDLKNWVYCYFDRIGKLIVLESGEGPRLPIEGGIFNEDVPAKQLGTLHSDGRITDKDGNLIGTVTLTGQVLGTDGKPFTTSELQIMNESGEIIGYVDSKGLRGLREERLAWLPAKDTCDLDKVRLVHLDGTAVTVDEYDGIHRFIRLWRKLGWSIDETDKALTGLVLKSAGNGSGNGTGETPDGTGTEGETCEFVGFDAFADTCETADGDDAGCGPEEGPDHDDGCPDPVPADYTISPVFLRQLVAVKKLLDLTGLPLIRLLAFWADISTAGEKSLYSRLFLTHNLLGIDKVFKADANGNYLTQDAKITDHIPVLMAALRLKADDILAIIALPFLKLTDALTLHNVTVLYRWSLLAKILHVRILELAEVVTLFGNPFKSPYQTLNFLTLWGRMEDAGFTFRQLNYLIRNHDDPLRPVAPAKKTILQLSKMLFDGLNAIDRDHPDVKDDQKGGATADIGSAPRPACSTSKRW